MTARRHERTRARRQALQVLYTCELTNRSSAEITVDDIYTAENEVVSAYALALVHGVGKHLDAIDECLSSTSQNWALRRMPIVDRSILRLAIYEILYVDDVPTSVAINEAVELAKDFGGEDDSSRFVNGVLGRIAKRLDGGEDEGVHTDLDTGFASTDLEEDEPIDPLTSSFMDSPRTVGTKRAQA